MKMFLSLLALLALIGGVPVVAAEGETPSVLLELATAPPACPAVAADPVSKAQNAELPPWLSSDPLFWAEVVAAGCGTYCIQNCDGCCAFPGPGICACC